MVKKNINENADGESRQVERIVIPPEHIKLTKLRKEFEKVFYANDKLLNTDEARKLLTLINYSLYRLQELCGMKI